ncbi:MAG: NAD(P)/FAD-dependent oxidoreductase [Bauldia sp.]
MQHGEASEPDELRSGASPWPPVDQPARQPLTESIRTDIAVIGAGITGAMCADVLTRPDRSLVLVDRSPPAMGSTAASTAILLAELDQPLRKLADRLGFDRAADVWRRSAAALGGLARLIETRPINCAFALRPTLLLAGPDDDGLRRLVAEADARRAAALPAELLEEAALAARHGLLRPAAIFSPHAAEADPVALTGALIRSALGRGARLVAGEARAYHRTGTGTGIAVELADGFAIEASHVVLATGYDLPDFLDLPIHAVGASWCLATEPQPDEALWPARALLWEDADPYLYARTTPDGRILIGGEDEPLRDPAAREAATPAKVEALLAKFAAITLQPRPRVAQAWSAEFGTTADGLPFIGPVAEMPGLLGAFGFGGNGITFSYMAAHVLAAMIDGEARPWFDAFALDRA